MLTRLIAISALVLGQPVQSAATSASATEEASPRAALSHYLDLCRDARYAPAAAYLDLPPGMADRGPELARRLKAVLDRHVWFDIARISDAPGGDTADGLDPNVEELARIPGGQGTSDPVRMVRVERDGHSTWAFTPATVRRIDGWYAELGQRWLLDHLPAPLLRPGPREILWWQWAALPVVLLAAWGLALVLARTSMAILAHFTARTSTTWDDALVRRLPGPICLAWSLALAAFGVGLLDLYAPAQRFVDEILSTGVSVALFWALLRSVDILGQVAAGSPWAKARPASRSLVSVAVRSGKIAVVALAVVAILSRWGYPVASLLAGLGIGGLALALAAQKTVENLFGSFSIAVDQPFREGDFVKVEDFVGTVEAIGLRSTRIRTLDRTLVTVPNGKLADMRVECFSVRDRIRLACTVSLVYGTTADQLRAVLNGLERVLREHPRIWPDAVVVRFKELAASSLDIEVMAWFQTSDWGEFQVMRQDVLLAFMDVVESAGSSFAFPTQTVHLEVERRRGGANGVSDGPTRRPQPTG